MPSPEKVTPGNFKLRKVLYNDGDFSVALGYCDGEKSLRLAMRWNGDDSGDQGYPKTFNHPVWFFIPDNLTTPFLGALLSTPYFLHSDIPGLLASGLTSGVLPLLRSRLASLGIRKKEQAVVGLLTVEIWALPKGIARTAVVSINNSDGSAGQGDFEDALRALLDRLDLFGGIKNLVFTTGGDFILPDWFFEECRRRGIEIHIIGQEDDIDEVIRRL